MRQQFVPLPIDLTATGSRIIACTDMPAGSRNRFKNGASWSGVIRKLPPEKRQFPPDVPISQILIDGNCSTFKTPLDRNGQCRSSSVASQGISPVTL